MLTETLLRIPIIVIGWCFYVLQRRPLIGWSENAKKSTLPVPESLDPVFAKTVSINSGTGGFGMIFQDHWWLPTVYAFSGLKSPLWRGLRKGFSKLIGTFIKASKYYSLYFSTSRHQTILKTISKCTGSAYLPFNKLFISWPKEGWNAQSVSLYVIFSYLAEFCLEIYFRTSPTLKHKSEAEFMNVKFRWGFWTSWEFSDLRFPYTMFTLQTSFKPLFLKGWGSKIR
jgi:hypothetical protein